MLPPHCEYVPLRRVHSAPATHIVVFYFPAKYEEAEENVPSVRVLAEYTNNTYQPSMIHQMEIMVLTRLSWSLTVVTPLHFLGLYIEKVRRATPPSLAAVAAASLANAFSSVA